jgi:hypothetical protein
MSGSCAELGHPSYAAMEWLQQAAEWFDGDNVMSLLAGCWALAHTSDPAAIAAASRKDTARSAVKRWARGLNCSWAELATAYNRIMAPHLVKTLPTSGAPAANDPPEIRAGMIRRTILRLQSEFGQDETYWLYGPLARMQEALRLLREQDDVESAALAKAQGKAVARDPDSPSVRAFVRWRKAQDAFFKQLGLDDGTEPTA